MSSDKETLCQMKSLFEAPRPLARGVVMLIF